MHKKNTHAYSFFLIHKKEKNKKREQNCILNTFIGPCSSKNYHRRTSKMTQKKRMKANSRSLQKNQPLYLTYHNSFHCQYNQPNSQLLTHKFPIFKPHYPNMPNEPPYWVQPQSSIIKLSKQTPL